MAEKRLKVFRRTTSVNQTWKLTDVYGYRVFNPSTVAVTVTGQTVPAGGGYSVGLDSNALITDILEVRMGATPGQIDIMYLQIDGTKDCLSR